MSPGSEQLDLTRQRNTRRVCGRSCISLVLCVTLSLTFVSVLCFGPTFSDSRAKAAPSAQDVVAVKRIMRYLSGTLDYGPVLGGTGESTLFAYSDADWGGDVDRKLTSGALHYFGEDLVHWTSKKQGCVALSPAEAE
jgi:hypothetical protein